MKTFFLITVILTATLNLTFQTDIANTIDKHWNISPASDGGTVINPLLADESLDMQQQLILDIPKHVALEIGTKSVFEHVQDLLKGIDEPIDVLFVGDSTISWGFDYHQFAVNSGLVTRSLSFGLNVPDQSLANAVAGIANCFMSESGVVILSFSDAVLGRKRGNRLQDKFIIEAASLQHDCDRLSKFWNDDRSNSWDFSIWEALTQREKYNHIVLSKLEGALEFSNPFWSAKISLYNRLDTWIFPVETTEPEEQLTFVRWDAAFRVPIVKTAKTWKNRSISVTDSRKKWTQRKKSFQNPKRVKVRKNNQAHWSDEAIGRPVCTVLPITMKNESYRYWEWLEWGSSSCMLVYANILESSQDSVRIEMQSNHHFANNSGLLMSAVLGKYFQHHIVLSASLDVVNQPENETIFLRSEIDAP